LDVTMPVDDPLCLAGVTLREKEGMQLLASITFGQVLTDEEFQRASDRRARRTEASQADDVAALEDLRDHGVLTDEEFQRAKDKAAA
jgi:Short C-terminal domain